MLRYETEWEITPEEQWSVFHSLPYIITYWYICVLCGVHFDTLPSLKTGNLIFLPLKSRAASLVGAEQSLCISLPHGNRTGIIYRICGLKALFRRLTIHTLSGEKFSREFSHELYN